MQAAHAKDCDMIHDHMEVTAAQAKRFLTDMIDNGWSFSFTPIADGMYEIRGCSDHILHLKSQAAVSTKVCRACKTAKPADEFPRRAHSRDGLYSYCRACDNEKSRNRKRKAAESTSNYDHNERNYYYRAWGSMKRRCYLPSCADYRDYGARGIQVCERWLDSFEAFVDDMGDRPTDRHSIDRIDYEGDYCPENCRWASVTQQARNKRNNRLLTFNGETKPMAEWAERFGINSSVICHRLKAGWQIGDAISAPLGSRLKHTEKSHAIN